MVAVEVVEEVAELSTVGEVELWCLTGGIVKWPWAKNRPQTWPKEAQISYSQTRHTSIQMHELNYRYGYAVQDDEGNDFNQQEQSDGEQVMMNTNKQTEGKTSAGAE